MQDEDGDGLLDVQHVVWRSGMIIVFANQGGGTFEEHLVYSNTAVRCECASAGDFDGDGDSDVVAGYQTGSEGGIEWFEQLGATADSSMKFGIPLRMGEADNPSELAVADLDGDGSAEIIAYDHILDGRTGAVEVVLEERPALGVGHGVLAKPYTGDDSPRGQHTRSVSKTERLRG